MTRWPRRQPRRDRYAPPGGRRRRWPRRLLGLVGMLLLAFVLGPAAFIATQCYGNGPGGKAPTAALDAYPNAAREESFTFLTLPEWLIVYSTEEYARFIVRDAPSRYPYFRAIGQYWRAYDSICEITRREYPFQMGYQVMLGVIGASFTAENAAKGIYENTVGRLTEWLGTHDTPEDAWAARTAREYGAFMHTVPWYQFPFAARLSALWRETPLWGPHVVRKWERRLALSAEYGGKAAYGWLMGLASQSAYGAEDLQVYALVDQAPASVFAKPDIKNIAELGPGKYVVLLPRYEAFTKAALGLNDEGVRFISVAGNDEILLSAVAPRDMNPALEPARVVMSLPILIDLGKTRLAVRTPLAELNKVVATLRARGAAVEHLYDY
jgi:hypothetical protein